MYQNCCKKCGSVSLHTEVKGNNTGLYCDDCGAWIKWLGKDELRAFEYANKSRGLRATAKLYDDAFANNEVNNEVNERLSRFIDSIDEAIDSVYDNPTAEHDKLIYNNAYAFALEKCKVGIQNIIKGREFNDSEESQ